MKALYTVLFIVFMSGISALVAEDFKSIQDRLNNTDPHEDPVEFAKVIYDAYKKTEKVRSHSTNNPEYAQYLKRVNRRKIEEGTICVDCPNLFLLTEGVNDILQHIESDPNSNIPPGVINEINALDGMFYFTKEEQRHSLKGADETPCERWELGRGNDLFGRKEKFEESDNVLIFSRKINFKNITQAQLLEPGVRKIYFFRAAYPHSDVIVKVSRDSRGNAEVSYYRNKEIYLKAKKKNDERLKDLAALGPHQRAKKLREEKLAREAAEKKAKTDHLDVDYGWNTEGDGFIPKKVTILSLDGAAHFDGITLEGGAEVSSQKQAAGVKLKSSDGKDFVGMEVEADGDVSLQSRTEFEDFAITGQVQQSGKSASGAIQFRDEKNKEVVEVSVDRAGLARLGIPMKFNVYDTGMVIDGKVVAGQDGSYGGTWSLADGVTKRRYLDLGLNGNNKGTGVSVGHSRKLSPNSSLGIKVVRDEFEDRRQTAGWIQYKLDF